MKYRDIVIVYNLIPVITFSCYRYAFIRYNSVDESISAYKQAHDLMWDTRSIIVRFRRQRGNTCLPGEPKPNVKKVKEEPNNAEQAKKEQKTNRTESKTNSKKEDSSNAGQVTKEDKINHTDKSPANQDSDVEIRLQDNSSKAQNKQILQAQEQNTALPTSITSAKTVQEQQQQPWVYLLNRYSQIVIFHPSCVVTLMH